MITFSASPKSLKKLTEFPYRGKAEWQDSPGGVVFDMKHEAQGERATGRIDLARKTFRIDYSTW